MAKFSKSGVYDKVPEEVTLILKISELLYNTCLYEKSVHAQNNSIRQAVSIEL